jgi:alkyldihydroxyacetonephosphate synthase
MGIARSQIRWNGWGWAAHQDSLATHEKFWRWLADELGMPALLATPARVLEDITLPATRLTPEQIAGFNAILGAERVMQDDYERAFHARGRSYHDLILLRAGDLSGAPDAVLYPHDEGEVLAVLQLAAREKIAVVPFGGGTGAAGGAMASSWPGSVTVDLSGMDRLLAVDLATGTAMAEAGISGAALEKALAAKGLTLDPAPGRCEFSTSEFSTLGGWIAAAPGRATDWLLEARLATPRGILDTEAVIGPDLTSLVRGSQGAFGIITRARVKLRPAVLPKNRVFRFRDFAGGSAAIHEALQAGIPHLTLRLSDAEETRVQRVFEELEKSPGWVERLKRAWLAARPSDSGTATLIAAFPDRASAHRFAALARKHGGKSEAPAKWEKRFLTPCQRDVMLDRGVGVDSFKTGAPWSALPAFYAAVHAALDGAMRAHGPRPGAHGLVLCHLSDADARGAGLHFTVVFPRQLENDVAQWRAIKQAVGETLLAKYGRGSEDNPAEQENIAPGLAALRGLKAALDPDGIMNPGKLFPPP